MSSLKDPKNTAKIPADSFMEPEEPRSSCACSCVDEVPILAFRCDGRVLLSTVDLQNVDLCHAAGYTT